MQLHELKPASYRTKKKRIARGGKRGKTGGRGTKGQKARAGHRIRPEVRDLIKKIPKLRGHGKNRARTVNDSVEKPAIVTLASLERVFQSGQVVTPAALKSNKLISSRGGKMPVVKILGSGELTKKLTVTNCEVSGGARKAIEAAGGSISA